MKKNNKNKFFLKFKNEYLGRGYATFCGALIVLLTFTIIIFLTVKGLSTFITHGYSITHFIFSGDWNPDGGDSLSPQFGTLMFIIASTAVSFLAVIVSAPVGVALAVFMNVISPKLGTKVLQPAIELFVGIPSVVYGWIGVSVLVPIIKIFFGGIGFSLLAGVLVISVMILPTITSISSDAIRTIPKDYIEASYGLGATRWQTIIKVIIPAAKSGILTGIVLGVSRAFGEALAVQMVIGNSLTFPKGLLGTTSTLTSILTMDMANTISGTPWNDALWSMALLLLIISFIFILIIRRIGKGGKV